MKKMNNKDHSRNKWTVPLESNDLCQYSDKNNKTSNFLS